MAMEPKNGLMVLNMKDSGETIKPTDEVNSFMLMETSMMENGSMIKRTEKVDTLTLMELYMKEIGSWINKREKGLSIGKMAHIMKDNLKMDQRKVKEYCNLLMVQCIKVNSTRMK